MAAPGFNSTSTVFVPYPGRTTVTTCFPGLHAEPAAQTAELLGGADVAVVDVDRRVVRLDLEAEASLRGRSDVSPGRLRSAPRLGVRGRRRRHGSRTSSSAPSKSISTGTPSMPESGPPCTSYRPVRSPSASLFCAPGFPKTRPSGVPLSSGSTTCSFFIPGRSFISSFDRDRLPRPDVELLHDRLVGRVTELEAVLPGLEVEVVGEAVEVVGLPDEGPVQVDLGGLRAHVGVDPRVLVRDRHAFVDDVDPAAAPAPARHPSPSRSPSPTTSPTGRPRATTSRRSRWAGSTSRRCPPP